MATHWNSSKKSLAKSSLKCFSLAGSICGGCLALMVGFAPATASAQQGLRNARAGDASAEARHKQMALTLYTFKVRDLRVLITPSFGLDWNDNVTISNGNAQSDFILKPSLQLSASYPFTDWNLLTLRVGIGYHKYIEHDELSTWSLQSSSGTELAFDVLVKNVSLNFHDRVEYTPDSAQESAVAGTGSFGNIVNSAGLSALWDLNDVTLSAGYDHANTFSGSQQFNSQDSANELFFGGVGFVLHPQITAGVEATASFTHYDQSKLNDNQNYSLGVYADWHPGTYFRIQPRVGYTISKFGQTSQQGIQTSDLNSWYASLNISHDVSEAISYDLDAGHEVRLGIESDAIETWYCRPGIKWRIIKGLGLNTYFSYEHGKQGAGNITGNLTETYDWFGTGLTATYQIMKKVSLSLSYRRTMRSSSGASRGYTQNMAGLLLTYQIQ